MKRTGRVFLIFIIIVGSGIGLWMFHGWKEIKRAQTKKTIHNVYITGQDKGKLYGMGEKKETWTLASGIQNIKKGIADIVMEEDLVVKIIQKPDVIKGKILKIGSDYVQVEEYGKVKLDNNFRLFRISDKGNVTPGRKDEMMVGATDIEYVVAGDHICAVLMGQKPLTSLRVLLSKNANTEYDMQEVVVTATTDYVINTGGKISKCQAGDKKVYHFDNVDKPIVIEPSQDGKVRILNLKRQCGIPEYRGRIEIEKADKFLHVINEVDLEQYLYSVVPSEMPSEYPLEALKAQAVCARSYALQQMLGKRLAHLGAHVDDSVGFQVYNNQKEDERVISAVDETRSLVISKDNTLVSAYFYSVSAGMSEGIKDVWFAKKDEAYLPVKWQGEKSKQMNLSKEREFSNFIKKKYEENYDVTSPWYRWQTIRTISSIQESINQKIKERYKANPTQIQTKQKDGTYRSDGNIEFGKLLGLKIVERGNGGVSRILELQGSRKTIQVYTEYNIRYILGDDKVIYMRNDKKEVSGLSMLPSGFFTIRKEGNAYRFCGGGYGHGVGMSQYGAKVMADQGKKYSDILNFYFSGTTVLSQEVLAKNGADAICDDADTD